MTEVMDTLFNVLNDAARHRARGINGATLVEKGVYLRILRRAVLHSKVTATNNELIVLANEQAKS